MGNEKYKIMVGAPLLRPGIKIEVGPVSRKYVVEVVRGVLEMVREINKP